MLVARSTWQHPASAASMRGASAPISTTARARPHERIGERLKSRPCRAARDEHERPSSPRTAATVAPTLVPLSRRSSARRSLRRRAACGAAVRESRAPPAASPRAGVRRPAQSAIAASTLATLCAPVSASSDAATSVFGRARAARPHRDRAPEAVAARLAERELDAAAHVVREARGAGIIGIDDRHFAAAVDHPFRGGVLVHARVAIQVVGAHVEHDGRARAQRLRALELEAGELEHVEVGGGSAQQVRGRARRDWRRRARSPRSPCSMSATSVVTVLLPLEPVTPITGARTARANNSMSPSTGIPLARAACTIGSDSDTPGDTTSCVAPRRSVASNPPVCTATSAATRCSSASSGGAARLSMDDHVVARLAQMAGHRKTGATEPDDDAALACPHQRTFSVARPSSTRDHRDDPEAHDHLGLGPALELEVMMQRRHAEDAPAGELVGADLEDHGRGLDDEHAAHDQQPPAPDAR
jgi:hypothetical protein